MKKRGSEPKAQSLAAVSQMLTNRHSLAVTFGVILILAVLPYSRGLHGEFLNWDDELLVVKNTRIRALTFSNLDAIFTVEAGRTFQPIRELSYALTQQAGDGTFAHHFGNVLLHSLSAAVLFLLLRRMLNQLRPGSDPDNQLVAAGVAILFACHPINVESVAWISSRKYGLLALFSFLSLYTYLRAQGRLSMSVASATCAMLAALSSPFGIVVPSVIVAYDFCIPQTTPRQLWQANKTPYTCHLVALAIVLPVVLLGLLGGESHVVKSVHTLSPPLRILQSFAVLADYAANLALPVNLNAKYAVYSTTALVTKALIALVLLTVSLYFIRRSAKKGNRLPLFCFLWFLLFWLPVSNLVPISTPIADRYMYLPGIGIFLAFVLAMDRLARKNPGPCLALLLAIFAIFAIGSYRRVAVWQSSLALWADSLQKAPGNLLALDRYGDALRRAGRMEEAAAQWERALSLNPKDPSAHRSMGAFFLWKGDRPTAITHLRRAVELDPSMAAAWSNLGACSLAERDYQQAIQHFQQAIRYKPVDMQYRADLGIALLAQGQVREALVAFQVASADIAQCQRIGDVLRKTKRHDEALSFYNQSLQADSTPRLYLGIGICHAAKGQDDKAVEFFRKAAQASPQDPATRKMIQDALSKLPPEYREKATP